MGEPQPDYEPIRTIEEFRTAVLVRDRIVITDETRQHPIVHDPECGQVREENFIEKVLTNTGQSGGYFRARNTTSAKEHGAVPGGCCYR